jgi:hypothetical protein
MTESTNGRRATFDRGVDRDRLIIVEIPGLPLADLHLLFQLHLERSFTRHTVEHLHACSGNPLHALEIARELAISGEPASGTLLPVRAETSVTSKALITQWTATCWCSESPDDRACALSDHRP